MKRAICSALLASLAIISPAHAGDPTITERAAEECENPIQLDDFGDGDFDTCYTTILEEIRAYNEVHGILTDDMPFERNTPIEEDEPGWNCHTMGNKICGPAVLTELPRTS